MGKRKDSRSKFSEAIDPRFCGIFNKSPKNENNESCFASQNARERLQISDGDQGFREFLSKKLFEYLSSHVKEVEIPIEKSDLFQYEIEEVSLLPNSVLLSENPSTESTETVPPKKKRKKQKINEKELFRQVAVTADWIEKQAKMLNS